MSCRKRLGDERGAASILVLALSALLGLIASTVVAVGAVGTARHRASTAADLAALAAAGRALEGAAAACAAAQDVAQAQGAGLGACRLTGDVADVAVEVRPAGPLGRLGSARGSARAGPAPGRPDVVPYAGPARRQPGRISRSARPSPRSVDEAQQRRRPPPRRPLAAARRPAPPGSPAAGPAAARGTAR